MTRSARSVACRRCATRPTIASSASEDRRSVENRSTWLTETVNLLDHEISSDMSLSARIQRDTIPREKEMRDQAGNSFGHPLVIEGVLPSESHGCDLRGSDACTTTSLGKSERDVGITTRRSSSPRREAHRG